MTDSLATEWPHTKRNSIAGQFLLLGKIGLYIQIALLAVPILLTLGLLLRGIPNRVSGIDLSNYLSFASMLVMLFTTYWFFRYMQLGQQIKDPQRCPSPTIVVSTLWVGLWAGCIGVVFSMLLLFGAAWRLLFVLLANPQSGVLIAPSLGTHPGYSISAFDAVSMTTLLIMLGAELVVLGITLWLLFKVTWPSQTEAETATMTLPQEQVDTVT